MLPIGFTVYGQPATQGSKKVVPILKGGQPVMKGGRPLTRAVNADPKLGQWRQQVAEVAQREYPGEPYLGPVGLRLIFTRPRPKAHFGSGRNADKIKPSAPPWPISRPDTLKLARAIEDALTGVVWKDDSQVVCHTLTKVYGERHEVFIFVKPMLEDPT